MRRARLVALRSDIDPADLRRSLLTAFSQAFARLVEARDAGIAAFRSGDSSSQRRAWRLVEAATVDLDKAFDALAALDAAALPAPALVSVPPAPAPPPPAAPAPKSEPPGPICGGGVHLL